ncbi:zinc finger c-x8-C-x5-C-x3-H type (and similar) domain-containing protein [Ditylenchus destructor]|nr:zinc finger c-x8-C-x5-C-x3-H type (and similar) domain-containing protein [Ditylenchus destructor]
MMLNKVDNFGLSEAQKLLQIRASPDFMKFLDESYQNYERSQAYISDLRSSKSKNLNFHALQHRNFDDDITDDYYFMPELEYLMSSQYKDYNRNAELLRLLGYGTFFLADGNSASAFHKTYVEQEFHDNESVKVKTLDDLIKKVTDLTTYLKKSSCVTEAFLCKHPAYSHVAPSFSAISLNPPLKWRDRLYKTQLCQHWETFSFCKFGANCWFAHGVSELKTK